MMMFSMFLGGNPKMVKIAVVNNESPMEPICQPFNDCLMVNLSCRFLQNIDHDMVRLVPYSSEDLAVEAVSRGEAWGVLSFPADYSDSISNRIIDGAQADNYTLLHSVALLRMDMSNQQIGFIIQRMLIFSFGQFISEMVSLCDIDRVLAEPPVEFGEAIFGTNEPLFQEYMAPGMLLCITFGLSLALSSGMLVAERKEGVIHRASASGVSDFQLLLGQIIIQLIIFVIQLFGMFLVMYLYLGMPIYNSIIGLIVLTTMQCGCGICCGFVLSVFAPDMTFLVVLIFSWFFPAFIMSSTLWPLEGIGQTWLRWVCLGFPTTWATEAARSMAIRGWGILHSGVWPGFLSTTIWTTFFILVTLICLRVFKANLLA